MICFVFRPKRRVNGKLQVTKYYSGKLRMDWETGNAAVIALGTSDKRIALDALNLIAKERHQERQGLLAPRQSREAAQRPLAELLEAYLADLRAKGRSENTIDKYRSDIAGLFKACEWEFLHCVNSRTFCEWRAGSARAPKSKNDMLASTCSLFNWLKRQRMLRENPLDGVERVDTRLVKRYRRALSSDEQVRLLAAAPRFRSVVYLLVLETGLRRDEINELTVADFHLDVPAPFVRLPACITKNRREANMRLRPHVAEAVRSVLPSYALPSEWVFHNRVPRISSFKRDLARAGIPFQNEHGRMDFHALRVTFCTSLLNSGAHPRVVQELMRHSDIKLTMKNYTDPSQLPIAAALDKLPVFSLGPVAVKNDIQNDIRIDILQPVPAVLEAAEAVPALQSGGVLQSL